VPKSEWLEGIEEHNIQISNHSPVLEGVIQQDEFGVQFRDGRSGGCHPIGILKVRHIRQRPFEGFGLVIATALLRPVSPADNTHPNALAPEPSGKPGDKRRLAGPSQGEIPHRDDRHFHLLGPQPVPVVRHVANRHRRSIKRILQAITRAEEVPLPGRGPGR